MVEEELYPDEDMSNVATIDTVLKDKPRKEKPKVNEKEELYKELVSLWNVFADGHAKGNITGARKSHNAVLSKYKKVILNE